MQGPNDGTRTLEQSTLVPELAKTLKDWAKGTEGTKPVIIGGLALSFHSKPRYTQDIDLLFLQPSDVPDAVPGFKKTRGHAFEHRETGVEIEVLDPQFINVSKHVVEHVYETAKEDPMGFKIPTREALIVLKLHRFKKQDEADIHALHETLKSPVNLLEWGYLPPKIRHNYSKVIIELFPAASLGD